MKKISNREMEYADLLLKGHKNKSIAEILGINEKTISTYKSRLCDKVGVSSDSNDVILASALQSAGLGTIPSIPIKQDVIYLSKFIEKNPNTVIFLSGDYSWPSFQSIVRDFAHIKDYKFLNVKKEGNELFYRVLKTTNNPHTLIFTDGVLVNEYFTDDYGKMAANLSKYMS